MKNKVTLLIFGSLITLSITSPPELLNNLPLNFSDLTITFALILIFILVIQQYSFSDLIDNIKNTYWLYILIVLTIALALYGLNSLTIRFIFYTLFGYLTFLFIRNFNVRELQYLFLPLFSITLLNVITAIFQLSFLDNSIGWISYYYENPNFFNRGRLAGYQGGGPNVAGAIFTFLTFISGYLFNMLKNKIYLLLSAINILLVFLTFSRGSYLALAVSVFFYLSIENFKIKTVVISSSALLLAVVLLLLNSNSQILVKESDRGYLTQIALNNLTFINGFGGGNYVEEIYGNYFLSINPKILEENLNITLDKVELGITPQEHRNSGIDFYIGTSGGGYEILEQSNIVSQCADDRITCQHVRADIETITKFVSVIFKNNLIKSEKFILDSGCKLETKELVTRGEFLCIINKIYSSGEFKIEKNIEQREFFVECEASQKYFCNSRKLAIGELSVIVENLTLNKKLVPIENYQLFCDECQFREVKGFIKIEFDKRQGIVPRSVFKFYTSDTGQTWSQVGFTRTKGKIVEFVNNNSYIEIGGHSDGQSFGNTFLDSVINSVEINTTESNNLIEFSKEYENDTFFVFKPNTTELYNANIMYNEFGLKLYRPNKYWVAVENNFNFNEDFEIILNLSFPEIPWETNTLISNTSIFNDQIQSWKIDIDDGRIFFSWTNDEGVYLADNIIGDKSLRSGILTSKNGLISNQSSPIVDPSFLSQLTTAHNGYLTFAVEYGLLLASLFYLVIGIFMFKIFKNKSNDHNLLFLCLLAFLIQNITNDMLYSADVFILFNLVLSIMFYLSKSFDLRKS